MIVDVVPEIDDIDNGFDDRDAADEALIELARDNMTDDQSSMLKRVD